MAIGDMDLHGGQEEFEPYNANSEGSGDTLQDQDNLNKDGKGNSQHVEHASSSGSPIEKSYSNHNKTHEGYPTDWDVRSRDFGGMEHGTGSGPGLTDSNDRIQTSDVANAQHVEDTSKKVGAGPGLLNSPNDNEPAPSHPLTENHLHYHNEQVHALENTPTYRTKDGQLHPSFSGPRSTVTNKTQQQVDHETTLSSMRSHLGLPEETTIIDDHHGHNHLTWSSIRYVLREPFAEFFGTFIMVLFGNASVAQVLLSTGDTGAPGANGFGSYQSINWGWGIGVMLGIYVSGDSGGFLNPAVTFAFCFFRKLPWRRWPIYALAQFLGGFVGAGVVYGNYINAVNAFEGGAGLRTVPPAANATAAIFCTYPQAFLTKTSQFFSEFIASAILIFCIFALKDDSNPGAMGKSGAGSLFPLCLLFLIFGLGACFGWETGYAINFARDFGPRLFSYIVGYGHEVWSAGGYYFWIPMVAPFCGCFFGGFLYDAFVYTGPESPVNSPWLGAKGVMTGRFWRDDRAKEREKGDKMV